MFPQHYFIALVPPYQGASPIMPDRSMLAHSMPLPCMLYSPPAQPFGAWSMQDAGAGLFNFGDSSFERSSCKTLHFLKNYVDFCVSRLKYVERHLLNEMPLCIVSSLMSGRTISFTNSKF